VAAKSETKRKERKGIDRRLIHLAAHPVRVQALCVLSERTASPKEVSIEIREQIATVSHHIKELEKMEMVELVDTRARRGAVEHFYRATKRPHLNSEEWEKLSVEERTPLSAWVLQLIMGDSAKALSCGSFDARADRHLSRASVVVDEEGWDELKQLHDETLQTQLEIQGASANRMAESKEDGFNVSASIICIETPVWRQQS
jgi:DNA-binding transcriptional ArsR family regulator